MYKTLFSMHFFCTAQSLEMVKTIKTNDATCIYAPIHVFVFERSIPMTTGIDQFII